MFTILQDFEQRLHAREADVESAQRRYQSLPALQRSTQQVESRLSGVVERWQHLCSQSRLYADRTRAAETLQSNLQELSQLLAQYEVAFSQNDALSADERVLKNTQQQLKVWRNKLIAFKYVIYLQSFIPWQLNHGESLNF